jgi:hypothetical protein
MGKDLFSDSSSESSIEMPTPKSRKIDVFDVQKFKSIELGEECLELLVVFISMTNIMKGKGDGILSCLISDGENFAVLETTNGSMVKLLKSVNLTNFKKRTFLLRRVSSQACPKKTNLGDVDVGFLFTDYATITEVTAKEYMIKDCFPKYWPNLKFFLSKEDKVKRIRSIDASLKLPAKLSFMAKVLSVSQDVKTVKDSNEVILTKIRIQLDENDDEMEITCWAHLGVFLGTVLSDYVNEYVGFAYIDVSSWVGRSITKFNLTFGADARIRLPEIAKKLEKKVVHAKFPAPPKFLSDIGGYEGRTICKYRLCVLS